MKGLTKHIVLFEPWGLGDLAVSLVGLRSLPEQGCRLSVVCDPSWADWVQSLPWVSDVISFHVPWTEKRGKYNPLKYRITEIARLRRKLLSPKPDFICEMRGDIRNDFFLRILFVAPVVTLRNRHFRNRYDRASALAKILGYPATDGKPIRNGRGGGVVCFFGAAWANRQVPIAKAKEIVQTLLQKLPCSVTVILQPNDDMSEWNELTELARGRFLPLNTSIAKIVAQVSSADTAICTDSAWLHLMYAQDIPTVGLFGFANADEWAPPGCRVVHSAIVHPAESRYCLNRESIQPLATLDASLVVNQVYDLINSQD